MEGINIPIIMTMTYGFIEILKSYFKNEKFFALIPIISAVFGGIIGLLIYYTIPQLIGNANFLEALIVGVCSGLSATGSNQISKQIQKFKDNKNNSNTTNDANQDNKE